VLRANKQQAGGRTHEVTSLFIRKISLHVSFSYNLPLSISLSSMFLSCLFPSFSHSLWKSEGKRLKRRCRIILKWFLKREDVKMLGRHNKLRIGSTGGIVWTQVSWMAESITTVSLRKRTLPRALTLFLSTTSNSETQYFNRKSTF
jgi:hypothetical protein